MPKVAMPTLGGSKFFSGWLFVVVAGLLLALYAIVDRGGLAAATGTAATGSAVTANAVSDGSTGCQLQVTTDQINVRAGPSQDTELLRILVRGDVVDGLPTVTNLYRELEDGTWATSEFLTPLPGSRCG
jgi:hypothetical protein